MRIRTLAANILMPSGIGIAVAVTWFLATGDVTPPGLTLVGLGFIAAGLAAGAEWATQCVMRARRRRTRSGPSRHRAQARPNPKTRKAA